MDRLERLINLVIALRETRRPLPAAEIRARVAGYHQETSPRSVGTPEGEAFRRMFERDKRDLRALGVPVETASLGPLDDTVGYRIDPRRYDLPAFDLDPQELAALALAVAATGLGDDAGAGLRKLAVDAGEPAAANTAAPGGLDVRLAAEHLPELVAAQATRTAVRFRYRPAGRRATTRSVDPHALVHRGGHWYLVGHDHDRDARRAFRLDRFEGDVTTIGEAGAFTVEAGVGTDDVVPAAAATGPQTATVLASPEIAWLVARRARGAGDEGPDGWTAFTVTVGDPDQFVGWALGLGPDLEVTGPPELRAEVVGALERLAAP